MRMRSVSFGVVFGVLLAVIVFVIARRITSATSPATTLDPVSVVHQIQRLNELVSVKYTVQKVVGLEEQKVHIGEEIPRVSERLARLKAKDTIQQAAIDMGILDQARRNAEAGIRSLLETFGVKSVTLASPVGNT